MSNENRLKKLPPKENPKFSVLAGFGAAEDKLSSLRIFTLADGSVTFGDSFGVISLVSSFPTA